jgi:hypothetical protein
MTTSNPDAKSPFQQLEDVLQLYLVEKAPALPSGWKEVLVKIIPWIILVVIIFTLPAVLFAFGLGTLLAPFGFLAGVGAGFVYLISMALAAVVLILEALALSGLFNRTRKGWTFAYYAALVGGVSNILSLSIGGLVGTLIGLYILFQIREHYQA